MDEEGRLWIGTNDNGVSIYVKGNVSNVMNIKSGLSSDSVRCIKEDSLGNYYVGTSETLCVLTMENGLKVKNVIPEIIYTADISASDDGLVAVITNSGCLYLMRDGEILGSYYSEDSKYYYTSCEFLNSGELLVGTSSNIIEVWNITDGKPNSINRIEAGSLKNINAFKRDENGNIWICGDNGIGYLNSQRNFISYNVNNYNSSIDNVMTDYHGNIWFVSSHMGLLKLCESEFWDLYGQNGLADTVVNSVTMWNGYCYSGTDEGLDIIDTENNQVIHNELTGRLTGHKIRCLKVDSQNQLWICKADGAGLLKVDDRDEVTVYNTENGTIGTAFRSILEMSDGTIAVAENTGLDFIRDGEVAATVGEKDGLTTPLILSLLELSDGTLFCRY